MTFARRQRRKTPRQLPDLPKFYYHTHFTNMLKFVAERYDHTLQEEHHQFLRLFKSLSLPAQYLYVRLAGRKGTVFDIAKLKYAEIGDLTEPADELASAGFIRAPGEQDLEEWLNVMTAPDLKFVLKQYLSPSHMPKNAKKAELVETGLNGLQFGNLSIPSNYVRQGRARALRYIEYLYFGKIETNLRRFAMRDLGLIKAPDFKSDYTARFDNLHEAQSAFFYDDALSKTKSGTDDEIAGLIDEVDYWPDAECRLSAVSRDRLLYKLGRLSERMDDLDTALNLFERSDSILCNERVIRIRFKQGDRDLVKTRLEAMIDNPSSDDEFEFASDFYARKFDGKRTGKFTDILRGGEEIIIDEAYRHKPEDAAARYYQKKGFEVFRTENSVWRMMFGLLFWSALFECDNAKIHNSFERLPNSLNTGEFGKHNVKAIAEMENILNNNGATTLRLLKNLSAHYGKSNGIFRWSQYTFEAVKRLAETSPPGALVSIMRKMAEDYTAMKDGYPDLMLIKNGVAEFVEVKAPGDVIRRNQLTRIEQIRKSGFQADIARIKWAIDPQQTYVVIDVETTGGSAGNHRITEIGAVKVRGGKVIDEYETLLNPERHISAFITRLTGISNEMVKDAPRFEEIADHLRSFCEGSVFVAHNVNFDYGFIRSEYSRIGQSFSFPKLCTCSAGRQYFKGFSSYGLANMCRELDIKLIRHHRAMPDARAAAEILFRINEKRLAEFSS